MPVLLPRNDIRLNLNIIHLPVCFSHCVMSDDVIPAGLPDWGATWKCVWAHWAPSEGQLDGRLHRPHQALRLQLWHQGKVFALVASVKCQKWKFLLTKPRHAFHIHLHFWAKQNCFNFISKHTLIPVAEHSTDCEQNYVQHCFYSFVLHLSASKCSFLGNAVLLHSNIWK